MGNRKAARNIVVIGGSAGALGPLIQIAGALPDDFPRRSSRSSIHRPMRRG